MTTRSSWNQCLGSSFSRVMVPWVIWPTIYPRWSHFSAIDPTQPLLDQARQIWSYSSRDGNFSFFDFNKREVNFDNEKYLNITFGLTDLVMETYVSSIIGIHLVKVALDFMEERTVRLTVAKISFHSGSGPQERLLIQWFFFYMDCLSSCEGGVIHHNSLETYLLFYQNIVMSNFYCVFWICLSLWWKSTL